MTPSGIESATFRLIAQCFTQLRRRVPPTNTHKEVKFIELKLQQKSLEPVAHYDLNIITACERSYTASEYTQRLIPGD